MFDYIINCYFSSFFSHEPWLHEWTGGLANSLTHSRANNIAISRANSIATSQKVSVRCWSCVCLVALCAASGADDDDGDNSNGSDVDVNDDDDDDNVVSTGSPAGCGGRTRGGEGNRVPLRYSTGSSSDWRTMRWVQFIGSAVVLSLLIHVTNI